MINLIIATICFSLSFGLIKSQLAGLSSDLITALRLILAFIVFIPFASKLNLKKHLTAGLIGAIQFGLMYLCFIESFKYLQGYEVAILTTTTPMFVALCSSLLGKKMKFIYLISIILSILGGIIIIYKTGPTDFVTHGVILVQLANFFFAIGQILWRNYIRDDSSKLMSSAYLGATICILPFFVLSGNIDIHSINYYQWITIAYLGIVPTGIGFWLWNKGAKQVSPQILSVMNNLKIPTSVLLSLMIFKEQIYLPQFILGCSLILIAIMVSYSKQK